MYPITSFFFFLCAGVMAMLMRVQLLGPDQHVVSDQQYNELFTMHGTIMLLLFATPPKMTGTMLNSRIGKVQFWFMFIGYQVRRGGSAPRPG